MRLKVAAEHQRIYHEYHDEGKHNIHKGCDIALAKAEIDDPAFKDSIMYHFQAPRAFDASDVYGKTAMVSGFPFLIDETNENRKSGDSYMYSLEGTCSKTQEDGGNAVV